MKTQGWLRQVPGFRSNTRWKQVIATLGYAGIAIFILGGFSPTNHVLLIMGVEALAVVLLATNALYT